MRWSLVIVLVALGQFNLFAQNKLLPEDFEQIIEEIFQNQDQDINYEELYEVLLLNLTSPIDLNTAKREELESMYILSNSQIQSLQNYLEKYGPLVTVFELQAVPLFNLATIRRILPFVTIHSKIGRKTFRELPHRIITNDNNYLILRYERTLERKKGYTPPNSKSESRYKGNADKYYLRFRTSYNKDFSVGLTLEKDAGETLSFQNGKTGFDYISYHLQLKEKGKLKNLILGDYQMQYGQGLVYGAGFNLGKGAESITTTRRVNLGAIPYTSVSEVGYFKGVVSSVEVHKNISFTAMTSSVRQSASLDSNEQGPFITSLRSSGLHRTESEIMGRKSIRETNVGGNIDYRTENLNMGANILRTHFSLPISPEDRVENRFRFSGDNNIVVSAYMDYRKFNQVIFGEFARSSFGGLGGILGVMTNLSSDLEAALVYRSYQKNFHSFYSSRFGESSNNTGEQGIYLGLKYQASRSWRLTSFFDVFRFVAPRFGISRPSTGYEVLTRLSYQPSKQINLYIQARQQSKADNLSSTIADPNIKIRKAEQAIKTSYLFNIDYALASWISAKSRFQGSFRQLDKTRTDGFTIVQDINVSFKKWRFSARIGLFQTDNFDNRQYIYERDVLYSFSIPPLSGRGSRSYLLVRYKANSKLDFWIKYGRTSFNDRKTVGSGLEEINDNKRTILRVQTRLKF